MRFKFIHLEQTAFSNVSGNLHIKWRGKAISYANVCMIPYFVIGGPYVAGWGCAGEESRRSGNMFDKYREMLRSKTHICTCPHAQQHTLGSHTSLHRSPSFFNPSHIHSLFVSHFLGLSHSWLPYFSLKTHSGEQLFTQEQMQHTN